MTLSIVACDVEAGVVGCAVTSCVIAASRRILHVRPGVGAAVSQASGLITWGDDVLDAMAQGASPADAIAPFHRDDSQLAAVSFDGDVAAHTGDACTTHRGHRVDDGVSAQCNMAVRDDAWDRMVDAFSTTVGPLAERLVAALAACGGDVRGWQAAGVIVTGRKALGGWPTEPHVDLRVDDSRDPVGDLDRLLRLHRAHNEMRSGASPTRLRELLQQHPGDPLLERDAARAEARAANEERSRSD
ncbi:MAG TPA: DUF1028 domain-containing protein [Acidimicrobiales bacterium]|nr:DUF1028 domain-containing protein [Acidimicrobiales bacterium]